MTTGTTPNQPSQSGDDLRAEAGQLRDAVIGLADRVDVAQRQTKLLRWLTLGVIAISVVMLVSGAVLGTLLFQQNQRTNRFLAESGRSRAAVFLIQDCITPAGTCAKRQQANTAKVIGQIVDANHNGKPDTQEILDAIKALKGTP
jgi:hypothetical protein